MKQKKAELFADIAHSEIGQKRKYTHHPYIEHPRNVAYLVKIIGGTDEMVSAAFLHDVLEDVAPICEQFNQKEIEKNFGENILNLVIWLTDISKNSDGNRDMRKKTDREHIANAPSEAQTIKLADLIDNSLNIIEHDPNFAKVYLKEKRLLLSVLKKGSQDLWNIADSILKRNGY